MFRRRPTAPGRSSPPAAATVLPKPGGKGRPTPRRSEAERRRRQVAQAPRDRKEAYRLARQRAKEERARARQAVLSGDERHLPNRDRGPVRAFIRDYVDARRSAAEFFLPAALVVLFLGFFQDPFLMTLSYVMWLALLAIMVVDSVIVVRGLRRQLGARFPDEPLRGTTSYALLRSMQIRRLRLPKPRVRPGEPVDSGRTRH